MLLLLSEGCLSALVSNDRHSVLGSWNKVAALCDCAAAFLSCREGLAALQGSSVRDSGCCA